MSPDHRSLIQAISLDVDGTMYSIRGMILRNLPTILSMRSFFRTLHHIRDGMRGLDPCVDFRAEQARRLALATDLTPGQAARRVEELIDRRWMSIFGHVRPHGGLVACLEQLSARGVRLAVCSDYPIAPKLEGLGLAHLPFESIVNAEDCGALKPHPAAFDQICRDLACPPHRVLHIGDLEANDVAGALGAGMRAALFRPGRSRQASRAHFVLRGWPDLIPRLDSLGWLSHPGG